MHFFFFSHILGIYANMWNQQLRSDNEQESDRNNTENQAGHDIQTISHGNGHGHSHGHH